MGTDPAKKFKLTANRPEYFPKAFRLFFIKTMKELTPEQTERQCTVDNEIYYLVNLLVPSNFVDKTKPTFSPTEGGPRVFGTIDWNQRWIGPLREKIRDTVFSELGLPLSGDMANIRKAVNDFDEAFYPSAQE